MWVADHDLRAGRRQHGRERHRRALSPVTGARLVREPQQQHPAAVQRFAMLVQQRGDAVEHVLGHAVVDVVGQLHEAEGPAEVLLYPPRQVRRVHRQAVAADARTRCETHETERLGGCGIDHPPHVDTELASEHRHLVHERDVDVAERVLEQLRHLGLGGRTDRHGAIHQRRVELVDRSQRRGVDARHHLRRVHERVGDVARVDALGRIPEVEVDPRLQVGRGLEDRAQQLLGGARVGGALQHHHTARTHVRTQHLAGELDRGEIRKGIGERRRNADDGDIETREIGRVVCGCVARRQRCAQLGLADVAHVALTAHECPDAFG